MSASPNLSPRRRRLRVTFVVLGLVAAVGLIIGWIAYRLTRTAQYRPGEASADITSELARNLPADAPRPRFTDATVTAGLADFRTFAGPRSSQLPEDNGPGAAWGDFNNDGLDDLLLVSAGGALAAPTNQLAACALYENLGHGRFRRVEQFPDLRVHGMAAAWGDYDEDGFLDLVITGYNTLLLLHNDGGTGRFTRDEHFVNRPGYWAGAAWGDYDRDRRPDLYVCGYVQYAENEADRIRVSQQIGTAVPYTLNPASYPAATNLLFHNLGGGRFEEVGQALGVGNPEGRSLGAVWHDFDDDGWLDLYVANDLSDNVLYRNVGGRFEDVSHPAHVADYRSAMGLAVGDFDRDGDDDLFVAHWIGQENALYQNLLAEYRQPAAATNQATSATPNATPGSGASTPRPAVQFIDVADMKGVGQIALPMVSWGAEFVDLDADGWLDLVVANGSTIEREGPAPHALEPQESFLFWNRRGEFFHNLAPLCPPLARPHVSRGLAVADYDLDGAMDLLIVHLGEGVQLLHNDMQSGRWLKVRLRSRLRDGSPRGFGDGARVTAWTGGIPLRRAVTGVSYLSQSSRTLHFGLGDATRVERLEVRWLGGGTNVFANLDADTTWEIIEGEPAPRRWAGPTTADAASAPPIASETSQNDDAKARVVEFWKHQRAGMNALKLDNNLTGAIGHFEAALRLDARHEDARYYLATCLAGSGRIDEALQQLATLTQANPQSHRAWTLAGTLRAIRRASPGELAEAERCLRQAQSLNPEETGALAVLGEIALIRGEPALAQQRLEAVSRTNPKAVGALYLRAYLERQAGHADRARVLLGEARQALGKDWQPRGATSEGDVRRKQHTETSPLSGAWEEWNGADDPNTAFTGLERRLSGTPASSR